MPKRKSSSKKTSLKRELAKLKKQKEKELKEKKELAELRKLQSEINKIKGVGTKRRVAAQITKQIGKDVGRVGLKGLKIAGNFVKNVIENEAREQQREKEFERKMRLKKK